MKIITELELFEISVVYHPINPDCEFPPDFWKQDDDE